MKTKLFTATNQRVQFYLNFTTEKPTTSAKRKRLEALKSTLEERDVMIDELFPNKRYTVLDEIVYLTSGSGIVKIGATKLAERCETSVGTVSNTVQAIKETDEFIVGRLIKTTGGLGKYIFVDKKHSNFREIMREVFSMSDYKFEQLFVEPFVERNFTESVEAVSVECNNQSPNIDISFIYKTSSTNNVYIENEIEKEAIKEAIDLEPTLSLDEQRQRLENYATNDYQVMLFDFLRDMPRLADPVANNLYKLSLSIGSDATIRHFHIAKDVIIELNMQLLTRKTTVKTSIRALFDTLYIERLKALKTHPTAPQDAIEVFTDKTHIPQPNLFYNWLEIRE